MSKDSQILLRLFLLVLFSGGFRVFGKFRVETPKKGVSNVFGGNFRRRQSLDDIIEPENRIFESSFVDVVEDRIPFAAVDNFVEDDADDNVGAKDAFENLLHFAKEDDADDDDDDDDADDRI